MTDIIKSQEEFILRARARLADAGLERRVHDGLVYWTNGNVGRASARPLALIHGVNDHAGTWSLVASELASSHRLIIPDLPGHGESEPRTGALHFNTFVPQLAELLDHEGVESLTLIGNSMGAWIAILFTLAHPSRVEHLVLESGGGLSVPLGVPLTATNRDDAMTILRAVHGPDALIPDWAIDALLARSTDSPMLRLVPMEMFANLVDNRIAEIDKPTTIVWGGHDRVVTRAYVDQLHAGIRSSRLCVIENAGHIPHAQQPERFVACLQAIF